jgi:hypothetical protein
MGKVKRLEVWHQLLARHFRSGTYAISSRLIFVEQSVQMVFLMINTRCSKHAEDTKNWIKTLIRKVYILLVYVTKICMDACMYVFIYSMYGSMYVCMYASMYEWMQKYRTTLNGRWTREKWIEQMWKVMVITEFDELSRNFHGETKGNLKNPWSKWYTALSRRLLCLTREIFRLSVIRTCQISANYVYRLL